MLTSGKCIICVIVIFLLFNPNTLLAIQGNVEKGTYATYEFQASLSVGNINNMFCEGEVGWICLDREGDLVEMKQWISFTIPYEYTDVINGNLDSNSIVYIGEEYVSMAKEEDLSFVPWFTEDDIAILDITEPWTYTDPSNGEETFINEYLVELAISGDYYFEMTVNVDLSTREVYDLDDNAIGRWLWWINPERYPYGEKTTEVFRYDWCNQEVNCTVKYVSEDTYDFWYIYDNRFKGEYDKCFTMNPWSVSCGVNEYGEENRFVASIAYSASSGLPIWARGGVGLQDDVTYIMTNGLDIYPYMEFDIEEGREGDVMFSLVESNLIPTNYEINEHHGYINYVLAMVAIICALLIIILYKKRDML